MSPCFSSAEAYTPLTWAIYHQKTEVVEALLSHDPALLLRANLEKHRNRNPLLVVLRMFDEAPMLSYQTDDGCVYSGKEVKPILDLLLAHGADFETMVRNFYPSERRFWSPVTKGSRHRVSDAVVELVHKVGSNFLYGLDPLTPRLWSLRDLCLRGVRGVVRGRMGDFCGDISALPLPDSLKEELLYSVGRWSSTELAWFLDAYTYENFRRNQ
jgi:hypothetical protein